MKTKILIVDDDRNLLRFLGEYLSGDGFEVYSANRGAEALQIAYQEHPALVVLDIMMPGMDGWEVTARIREMARIPVILVTGKTTEADKLRGFKLGADDYLTKPFSFAELAARIRAVLARSHSAQPSGLQVIRYSNLTIFLDKRIVKRGDQEIALTPTEYRLLEYLARNQDRAVAESELAQAVWGNYKEEDASSVRRYIWLLRQKVETDPSLPQLVKTVRGYGYRLGTAALQPPEDTASGSVS